MKLRNIIALAALALSAGAASAETYGLETPIVTPQGAFNFSCTIAVPADGDLYLDTNTSQYDFLSLDGKGCDSHNYGGTYGHVLVWKDITAGEHELSHGWCDGGETLYFYQLASLELTDVSPEQNTAVGSDVNSTGDIILQFNQPVTFSASYLLKLTGEKSGAMGGSSGSSMRQGVRVKKAMEAWYDNGTFKPEGGEQFFVVVEGIRNEKGDLLNGNGSLTLSYVSAKKSLMMTNYDFSDLQNFCSYYPEGDSRAIFNITFDGDVCTEGNYAPYVSFGIGDLEDPDAYYYETITPQVNGNVVTIDLSGVNRRMAIKQKGDWNGSYIALRLANVYDLDHNLARGRYDGNLGSFPFTLVYEELPEVVVDYSFQPETGSSLENVSQITLWHTNLQVMQSFEGIEFSYADGSRDLIAAADLQNLASATGEARYKIDVPERAKTEPVTVSLAGIVSYDGYDKHLEARYNQFTIVYSTPFANYGTYESIAAGDPINLEFNETEWGNFAWTITDLGNGLKLASGTVTPDVWDYSGTCPADLTFYLGHTYELSVADTDGLAPEPKTASIIFYGASRPISYSPVEFESITPDPADNGALGPEILTIVVNYSDDVAINRTTSGWVSNASGELCPFEGIRALERNGTSAKYAYSWALTLPAEALEKGHKVCVHIGATDTDNPALTVRGDLNTDDASDVKVFLFAHDASGISVVEAIRSADQPRGVYNLQGIRVAETVDDPALPAGIYISAGRKVRK